MAQNPAQSVDRKRTTNNSMNTPNICILGGTGFVGHSLVVKLADRGWPVTVLTRRREDHRDLLVLPTVRLVQGNVLDPAFLAMELADHDVVINLVAILNESRNRPGFERIHVQLPGMVAEACRNQGVRRLLHMSALKASSGGPSEYLRSKGIGEDRVHNAGGQRLHVTSFRPSVMFGDGQDLTRRFARLLRMSPGVLPLACPEARFQPVWVEDVTDAIINSIDNYHTFGKRYELCGPRVYTLREIVEYVAKTAGIHRKVIGLGPAMSRLQAVIGEMMPGKPFTLDNYRSLQIDSVCKEGFPPVLGVTPTAMEAVAWHWLAHERRIHPRRPV
jgi:uncharacterized protein YbjT (DUF2867 family)